MLLEAALWSMLLPPALPVTTYSDYILAPSSPFLEPKFVYNINGTVNSPEALTSNGSGSTTLTANSAVTFDYGKNIGGSASFYVESASSVGGFIGLSFSESSLWISPYGSDATHDTLIDEELWFNITGPGNYSVDHKHDRGGFRSFQWRNNAPAISLAANKYLWNETAGFYSSPSQPGISPQDGNVYAVVSGIADPAQAQRISTNLRARWTPYGAPAPEATTFISPYISGFELQAHVLAGQPQNAIDLIRLMWHGYMLENPYTTDSTFLEGYNTSGSFHYPAYENDARVSHAHGWSLGPVSALTSLVAGIKVLSSKEWRI